MRVPVILAITILVIHLILILAASKVSTDQTDRLGLMVLRWELPQYDSAENVGFVKYWANCHKKYQVDSSMSCFVRAR